MEATTRKPENATLVLVRVDTVAPPFSCPSSSSSPALAGATPALPSPARDAVAAAVPAVPAAPAAPAIPATFLADTGLECKIKSLPPLPSSPSSPHQPRPAPHTLHSFTRAPRPKRLSRTQSSPTISTAADAVSRSPSSSNKMGRLSSFGSRRSTDVVLTEGGRKPSFSVLRRGRMASVEELAPEQQRVGEEERDRRERSLERRTVVIKPDAADDCSPPYTKEEARRIRHAKRKAEGGVCYCQEEGKPGVLVPEDDTRTAPGATGAAVTAAAKRVRAWVVRTSSASSSVADDQRKKRDDMIEEGIVFDGPAARKGLLVGQDDDDANPTSPYGVIEWRQGRPPSRESAAVTSGSEADDDSDNEQQDTLSLDHSSNKAEWAGGAAAIVVVEKKHEQPAPLSPLPTTPTTPKSASRHLRRQSTLESIIHKVPFLHHRRRASDRSSTTAASAHHPPPVIKLHDNDSSSVPGTIDHYSTKPSSACISEDAVADNNNNNSNRQQQQQQQQQPSSHPSGLKNWLAQPHTRRAQRAAISSPDEFFDLLWRKYPLLFTNYPEIQTYLDVPGPADKLERLTDDYMPQLALNADEALDEDEEKSEEEKRERVRAALHDVYRMWVDGALVDWAKSKGWRLEMNVAEWEVKGKDESGNVTTAGVKGEKRKERKDSSQGQQQTPEDSHGLKKVMEGVGRKVGGVFTRKRSGLAARVGMGEG